MKSLFITLLILASAFLFYDAFIVPPHERLVFEKGPPPAPPAPVVKPLPPAATPGSKPAPAPAAAAAKPTPVAPPTDGFVPPVIASLEEATKNWSTIPERAFPRNVVLKQAVEIKMSVGSGQLAAGTTALALSASQGVLTVAPAQGSTARGQIPVTATDFPDQISSAYEAWKTHRIQIARESYEARLNAKSGSAIPTAEQIDLAGKPIANSNGTYNLLLESMRTGQVSEVRPKNIRSWGSARAGLVDGKPGWLVEVDFTATTMFGQFDTQAQAQIRDGKIIRWIYTGSGEEVP